MKTKSNETPHTPITNSYVNFDSQLNEWSQMLTEFKGRLTEVSADIQNEASQKIEDLEKKYNTASEKMNDLKSKGLLAKDEMKIGFEKAWKELTQAFESAKKTFH
jgi:hypothetical protein